MSGNGVGSSLRSAISLEKFLVIPIVRTLEPLPSRDRLFSGVPFA